MTFDPDKTKVLKIAIGAYEWTVGFGRILYYGIAPLRDKTSKQDAQKKMHNFIEGIEINFKPKYNDPLSLRIREKKALLSLIDMHKTVYGNKKKNELEGIQEMLAGIETEITKLKDKTENKNNNKDNKDNNNNKNNNNNNNNKKSLEDKLNSMGDHYIPLEKIPHSQAPLLWKTALEYDLKGIIPGPHEKLTQFIFRGNTLLYAHKQLKKNRKELKFTVNNKEFSYELDLEPNSIPKFIRQKDLEKANKKIPYYMDLTWVAAYIKNPKDLMVPALGITFTLPDYNGINFIQMRDEYKNEKQFFNVLAHEMVHAGTVYLETRKQYVETKAYHVGKGSMVLGEYAVALNARPRLWMNAMKWTIEFFLRTTMPDKWLKIVPKIKSGIDIVENTGSFRETKKYLEKLYGQKGNYILGRLNADEMEEFRDTNDIPGRIALKKDLKWQIMKTNLEKIE